MDALFVQSISDLADVRLGEQTRSKMTMLPFMIRSQKRIFLVNNPQPGPGGDRILSNSLTAQLWEVQSKKF